MKISTRFALSLAALLFGLLLVPRAAQASTADCPVEPKQNVPIGDGEVLTGANCTLKTAGDIDSFVFSGTSGDTYQLAVAIDGSAPTNICLTLYNPSAVSVYSGCTNISFGGFSVVTDQTLTATGTYTIDITETSTATVNYAVSLERLYPFPPNAQGVTLSTVVDGDIAELTDSNAFTFGVVTTGTYEVSATLPSGASQNLCMTLYSPTGTSAGSGCTNISFGGLTVQLDATPTQDGTMMAFVSVAGNDGTATYSLEVSCLVGNCKVIPPPPCTLKNALTYNATTSTLTMNFTVGNNVATTWNAWLTDQNTMTNLFSLSQPITVPPVPITKTTTLSPEGTVGVLSTLTTPTKGIFCSSYMQINTGTP
ncbi:MAG: hypothetical protein WAL89_04790 [Candidatus Sulfotelmatobacter sp.]|jgi:hypothetical protein